MRDSRIAARLYTARMTKAHAVIGLLFVLVLGVPFLLHTASDNQRPEGVRTLVVVTPHVLQIQDEFGRAFAAWHEREYGEEVWVDFRLPGGTSEILKLLKAQYAAAAQRNLDDLRKADPARVRAGEFGAEELIRPGDIAFDLMFGGGSYDHTLLCDARETPLWYRPFAGEGATKVMVRVPSPERFDWKLLERNDPIALEVLVDGAWRTLRTPRTAIEGGFAVLEALRTNPGQVEVQVNLGACEALAVYTMARPMEVSQKQLDDWYRLSDGTSARIIGAGELYRLASAAPEDPDALRSVYWLGTALSGFGIVFNRHTLGELGIPEPDGFEDLCDPRLAGWVALADPRMSGSIETAFESVLNNEDWDLGWRILRGMCANARYITDMSTKPPVDVAHGEAAMGVCIDFYGRSQAQAVMREGETPKTSRVGYVDPPGKVFIDPDPITMLRGGSDPELARRFVEFVMTDEGQALWQFRATSTEAGRNNPPLPRMFDGVFGSSEILPRDAKAKESFERRLTGYIVISVGACVLAAVVIIVRSLRRRAKHRGARAVLFLILAVILVAAAIYIGLREISESTAQPDLQRKQSQEFNLMGPRNHELRRMPVRQAFIEEYWDHLIDQVDPYEIASTQKPRGWRSAIRPMMGAFGIDTAHELHAAWRAYHRAKEQGADEATLAKMERLLYVLPEGDRVRDLWDRMFADEAVRPEAAFVDFTPENYRAVRETWRNPRFAGRLQIVYTAYFRENYARIEELAEE